MKLDVNVLRYMEKDCWRVLTAVEMGLKNHEIVPAVLIESIAGLKHGGCFKQLKELLRNKLVHHENRHYDGYRLTYLGYDYLAIKTLLVRGAIVGMGRQIGVGKESDIFEVVNEEGVTMALKLHRLGRTSFRAVKNKRDYLKPKQSFNWLYLSRLAALKEFAFMKALQDNGFRVPDAIECNRHAVLMSMVPALPFTQVRELENPDYVYEQVIRMLVRMAEYGLVHCDLNEFNLMVDEDENVTMIDFPQMVSVSHPNAKMYFERDAQCLRIYFARKFGVSEETGLMPLPVFEELALCTEGKLDTTLRASGFTKEAEAALSQALEATREAEGSGAEDEEEGDEEGESGDAGGWEREEGQAEQGEQAEQAEGSSSEEDESEEDEGEGRRSKRHLGPKPPRAPKAAKPKPDARDMMMRQKAQLQRQKQHAKTVAGRKSNRNKGKASAGDGGSVW